MFYNGNVKEQIMKKIKNNFFKTALIVGSFMIVGLLFTGCGSTSLKTEDDIKEQMFAKEEFLIENVYGQQGKDFNTTGSDDVVANENYYVKIATEVKEEIETIKLGHVVYEIDDRAETKVASGSNLTRDAFFMDEEELHISNVLMFLNVSNDGVLRISFPENKINQILVNVYEEDGNKLKLKVTQVTEETLDVVDAMGLKYKFSNDNPNGKAFFELSLEEENLEDDQVLLIQTVANPERNNQTFASRFETPIAISGGQNTGFEITPGYQAEEFTTTVPANHKIVYNVYVPGQGAKTVVIDFVNTKKA